MKFICILIFCFLVSCASVDKNQPVVISYKDYSSQTNINDFNDLSFSAKITLFVEKRGFTGKLIWNAKSGKSSITILNPFNSVISKVYLNKSNNTLKISSISKNKNEISDDNLNCEFEGVMGTTASIVGTAQANEALKMIIKIGQNLKNQILIIDLLNLNFRKVKFKDK